MRLFPLLQELRRRRVFRVAGLYVVTVWLLMQAANILFPAWGIPDTAIRYLLWAGLLGLPVALAFGWVFDISAEGIRRTQPVGSEEELQRSLPLGRTDYVILTAFLLVAGAIVVDTTGRVMQATVTTDAHWPSDLQTSVAEIDLHSVAVLPFTDLSPERDQSYFSDGMSEEILNRLAAFRELKVMARTSSFVFKDSGYGIARISGLLSVNYLLQGSVRRDGQQLRISAQLVDRTGVQIWSNTFDREVGAIFSLQDEIAEAVATSIMPQIVPPARSMRLPDLEAYEQYLIAREMMTARVPGWITRSYDYLSRAIELDPEFAEAYAERAIALTFSMETLDPDSEAMDKAQRDISTALALKPNLARAHAAQVRIQWQREPAAFKAREQMLLHVLTLDPNMVDALNWLAIAVNQQGRAGEALAIHRRAARIDPLAPAVNYNLAQDDRRQGNFEQAEERLLRLLEVPEPSHFAFWGLIRLYAQTGRLVDAVQTSKRQNLNSAKGDSELQVGEILDLIRHYAILGMWDQAEHWQYWSEHRWPDAYLVRIFRTRVARHAGRIEEERYAAEFRAALAGAGVNADQLPPFLALVYGVMQATSGEYDGAIATLERLVGPGRTPPPSAESAAVDARQALAWSWLQTGERSKAVALLELMDTNYSQQLAAGQFVPGSEWLANFALNSLLLGDEARALELLERAADAGWREYYLAIRDRRWAQVQDEPRFQSIMARVKADIDLQRARVEEIDTADNFEARLDAAIEAGSRNR